MTIITKLILAERAKARAAFPKEFDDGARYWFSADSVDEPGRERGGFPRRFRDWSLERRDAWWAGACQGIDDRNARERGLQ